jgi:hypothetical protein
VPETTFELAERALRHTGGAADVQVTVVRERSLV